MIKSHSLNTVRHLDPAILNFVYFKTTKGAPFCQRASRQGRLLVGRPLVGRPLAGRPLVGRPQAGRPLAGRPLAG